MTKYATIDDYIAAQSPEIAEQLSILRSVFHELLPQTEESIRYDMPAFTVGGEHLYISAYKHHIGMYPMYGISELNDEMLPYRGEGTKDALHFMHDKPLPLDVIKRIIIAKSSTSHA